MRRALRDWALVAVSVVFGFGVAAMAPHFWGDKALIVLGWLLIGLFVLWLLLVLWALVFVRPKGQGR